MSRIGRWVFERDGNAVAALLFALAGLIAYGIILGPIAIGLGLMARRNIERRRGRGSAWRGPGSSSAWWRSSCPFYVL